MLVPVFLLALVLARMFSLALSMHRVGADIPSFASEQLGEESAASADVKPGPLVARGEIEGIVIVVSAILLDPYATPQLPPTARFMSGDDMPFQLRTADFTTDQAVCSGMPAGGATGFYRFDFHDGGLSYGEVYDFLTFVTQSYRPVSLCDQRLRIPRPAEWAVPVVRYVAR